MSVSRTENSSSSNGNGNGNDAPFWLNIPGMKEGTNVAFSLTRAFKDATRENVYRIFQTQEVRVKASGDRVTVAVVGQREDGNRFAFGYLNNYAHGLEPTEEQSTMDAVGYEIEATVKALVPDDIEKPMSSSEAADILAAL